MPSRDSPNGHFSEKYCGSACGSRTVDHTHPLSTRCQSLREALARSLVGVEFLEQRCGYPFDYVDLLGSEIFSPAPGCRLAVEFALSLLSFWHIFPGVPLHRPLELPLIHSYPQLRVDALHGAQGVRAQVLVEDECFGSLTRVVAQLRVAHIPQVLVGSLLYEGIGVLLRQRYPHTPALVVPAPLLVSVHAGRHNIPGISNQADHTALWQRLHQKRRSYRAVGLLDDEVVVLFEVGEGSGCGVQHEVPYGVQPALPVASQDEVGALMPPLARLVVEVAEERPHPWLLPQGLAAQLSHHGGEPGAAASTRAEDPDDVLGVDAPDRATLRPCPQSFEFSPFVSQLPTGSLKLPSSLLQETFDLP